MSRRGEPETYRVICQFGDVGGHYECDSEEVVYKTIYGYQLCALHAWIWAGLIPLHPDDTGLIRSINARR